MNAGRSAAAISSPSAAHAASSGDAPTSSRDSPLGTSPDAGPNTSSGKSRKTGPRCGELARRAASNTILPAAAESVTVAADLVIDDRIGTWSSSCNDPDPQRPCGARPPRTTSGDPLNHADVTAEMPLVIPGPAVSAASPGRRVSLA